MEPPIADGTRLPVLESFEGRPPGLPFTPSIVERNRGLASRQAILSRLVPPTMRQPGATDLSMLRSVAPKTRPSPLAECRHKTRELLRTATFADWPLLGIEGLQTP